jgi:hypothetical protein
MQRIKSIIHGWYLWVTSNKEANALSETRTPICNLCQHRNKLLNVCNECGCFLPAKTRVKDAQCPHDYWS